MNQLKNILVGIDFSDCSKSALQQAMRMARWNHATLHALHGLEHLVISETAEALHWSYEVLERACVSDARKELNAWLSTAEAPVGTTVQVEVGPPIDSVLKKVNETAADLLVLGVTGSSLVPRGAGALATKCLRKAPTKVMLVKQRHTEPFRRVVAAVDFSETARLVLDQARRVASQDQSEVHCLHVFDPPWRRLHYRMATPQASPDFQQQFEAALLGRLKEFVGPAEGLNLRTELFPYANYGVGLAEYARQVGADLIILGARGRTNLKYVLLGSTAEWLLRELTCSVLTVKSRQEGVLVPVENPDKPQ